jgi:murein L,D-transpeptidase YcbB/YkuD
LNVPSSILRKEILPAIAKNSNYLAKHDMEWVGRRVRQRPGLQNALKVKLFSQLILFFMIRHQKAYLIENKGPLVMVVSG